MSKGSKKIVAKTAKKRNADAGKEGLNVTKKLRLSRQRISPKKNVPNDVTSNLKSNGKAKSPIKRPKKGANPLKKGATDHTGFDVGRNNNAILSNVVVEQNTLPLKIVESSRSRPVDGKKLRRHLLRERYSPARAKETERTEKSPGNANPRQTILTEGRTP